MTLEFEIPLPPIACSPNRASHQHWRLRHAGTKQYRSDCQILALKARGLNWPGDKPIHIYPTFYCGPTLDRRYRPLDGSNGAASLKAAIDGFVDAKLVPADSHKWVKLYPPELLRTKKEHLGRACVVIRIEVLES